MAFQTINPDTKTQQLVKEADRLLINLRATESLCSKEKGCVQTQVEYEVINSAEDIIDYRTDHLTFVLNQH